MSKLKKNCSPEAWAAHLKARREYVNSSEQTRAKARAAKNAWRRSESGRAKLREYDARPRVKARRQAKDRRRGTGMVQQVFEDLMTLQGGKCDVCGVAFDDQRRPHADHCHETGRPRGLLCRACNLAEGHIKKTGLDPVEFARRLSRYLSKPPAELI